MSSLALVDKLEKQWDRELFDSRKGLAPMLGWWSYHTLRSQGSQPGFPDRVLMKERTIFVELKRELTGKRSEDAKRSPAPAQVRILDRLARAGSEVYVWRPSDLDEIALILSKPWQFFRYVRGSISYDKPPHLTSTIDPGGWIPRSIWVPGAGRADEAGIS